MTVPNSVYQPALRICKWGGAGRQILVPIIGVQGGHVAGRLKTFKIVWIESTLLPIKDASNFVVTMLVGLNYDVLRSKVSMGKDDGRGLIR